MPVLGIVFNNDLTSVWLNRTDGMLDGLRFGSYEELSGDLPWEVFAYVDSENLFCYVAKIDAKLGLERFNMKKFNLFNNRDMVEGLPILLCLAFNHCETGSKDIWSNS